MSDKPKNQPMTGQDRQAFRDYMLAAGVPNSEIVKLLGGSSKHRATIANDTAAYCRELKKVKHGTS